MESQEKPKDEGYRFNQSFPTGEATNSSAIPINPFVVWRDLLFKNPITILTEEHLGAERSGFAGIELNLSLEKPFSLFMVHGKNKKDELVCFMFINEDLMNTFVNRELVEPVIWELKVPISMNEMRAKQLTPEVLSNQLPLSLF